MFSLHVNVIRLSKRQSKKLTLSWSRVIFMKNKYKTYGRDSVSKDNQNKLYVKSV